MSALSPRIVLVHRASEYQMLIERHGTRGQAAFFLKSRGQRIEDTFASHSVLSRVLKKTKTMIPADWSIAEVERDELDRFLFSSNDIIIAVGQDGLVANLAKYTSGQPVIGVTPGGNGSEGVLTSTQSHNVPSMLEALEGGTAKFEPRTMVEAQLGNGDSLIALNELFIGHRSHQSAKYIIQDGYSKEFQSSSGLIVSTGTGATGWAKSIMLATHQNYDLDPTQGEAVYFSREPWPSRTTTTQLSSGTVHNKKHLYVISRINDGGVIFADGIEQDFLKFDWGQTVEIRVAGKTLNLMR